MHMTNGSDGLKLFVHAGWWPSITPAERRERLEAFLSTAVGSSLLGGPAKHDILPTLRALPQAFWVWVAETPVRPNTRRHFAFPASKQEEASSPGHMAAYPK